MSRWPLGLRAREEAQRFLAAIQYFTRLPVPSWVGHSQSLLNDAVRYFPAVGLVVGALAALTVVAGQRLWPTPVAVALSMVVSALVTGAFHEDGLADAVDGLGGSFDRVRALEIMKDSRIGSFGALALTLVLLLKFATLSTAVDAGLLLLGGHTVSRFASVVLMRTLPYVREDDRSRSKPLVQLVSTPTVVVATVTTVGAIAAVGVRAIPGVAAALLVLLGWRWVLRRRLAGYTGDALGALQQLAECAFYLGCVAQW